MGHTQMVPVDFSTITGVENIKSSGLEHGRYQIKKSQTQTNVDKKPTEKVKRKLASEPIQTEAKENVGNSLAPEPPPPTVPITETPAENEKPRTIEEPSLTTHAQSLINENSKEIINAYKEQIHPDDLRNNRLEIQFSPTLIYNDSQSNYTYRSYSSFFSGLDISSKVWLTPAIGISGKILFSIGANLPGDSTTQSRVPVRYEFLDLGMNFRRFFGMDRLSPSMDVGLVYSTWVLNVPSDETRRIRLNSAGLGVSLLSRIPSTLQHAWLLGGTYFPRLHHTEMKTGVNVNSGGASENSRWGISLGSEYKFSRESLFIYDFSITSERNLFDGAANTIDPEKGTTPSNVSVTNSMIMFSFGYRWGK